MSYLQKIGFTAFLFAVTGFLTSCEYFQHNDVEEETFYRKTSEKFYSPDRRCFATVVEHGLDSASANTQVLLTFEKTGAGVYAVKGTNRNLKLSWKDDSTLVIQTKKEYQSSQKWPTVGSFGDVIRVEYVER